MLKIMIIKIILKKCIKVLDDKPLLISITKINIRKLSTFDIINAYELNKLLDRKKIWFNWMLKLYYERY